MDQDPSGSSEKCLTRVAFGKVLSLLQQEFDMTCFLLYIVLEKDDFDLHCFLLFKMGADQVKQLVCFILWNLPLTIQNSHGYLAMAQFISPSPIQRKFGSNQSVLGMSGRR
jgi:hypothetical protein